MATASGSVAGGNGAGASLSTAVPVAQTAHPPQEDSLNLIKLVGPAILKRIVPVAAAAAGLAVLSRFFWRLRHRRAGKA